MRTSYLRDFALCTGAATLTLMTAGLPAQTVAPSVWVDQVMSVRSLVAGEPQWSPDGSRIMFASSLGSGPGLWAVPADGGFPIRLAQDLGGVPFQLSQQPRWSPVGDWISYVSDGGVTDGPPEIWVWSVADGRRLKLTNLGARIGSTTWSPDGKWIAFSGGLEGNYDIWKVSVPGGEVHRLTSDPRYEVAPTWTRNAGGILYVVTDDRWVDHDVMEMNADGRSPRVVLQDRDFFDYNTSGVPSFGPPLLSPDGSTVLFRSWRSGWINYWTVPLAGGEPRPVAPERWAQSGAEWSPDGRQVAFTSNRNGTHDLVVVTRVGAGGQWSAPRVLVAPGQGVAGNLAWAPDGKRLSYTLASPTRAADLHVVSAETGVSKQLTFSTPGASLERALVVPEKISYKSDTLTINALLYRPRAVRPGERLPVVMFAHGGPTGQYGDTYDQQMQFFAGQGYVVVAPNFRGGSGYGRAFADLNNKCWAHCDVADFVAGIEHLKTLPFVDPSRVGVTGTSHGGLVAMGAATFFPGVFRATIAHGGTADRIHYYHTQELRHIKQAENEFGPLKGNEETYRYVSPFYWVRQVNTPQLVIWGEGRWPASDNSARYVAELERQYKPHEWKVYRGENYYVSGRANTRQMMLDMLAYFDRYLKDPQTSGAPVAPVGGR